MIEFKIKNYTLTDVKILYNFMKNANDCCTADCTGEECNDCIKYKVCRDFNQGLSFLENRIKYNRGIDP